MFFSKKGMGIVIMIYDIYDIYIYAIYAIYDYIYSIIYKMINITIYNLYNIRYNYIYIYITNKENMDRWGSPKSQDLRGEISAMTVGDVRQRKGQCYYH